MWQKRFGYSQWGRLEAACVHVKMCSNKGRDDCQQLKPKGSHASFVTTVIAVTILLMLSILFSRVTVNVLVVLQVVFYITRYMYGARCQDFALSASFVSELKCFDGSEVTAKRQWLNCTEAKLCRRGSKRTWIYLFLVVRGKFIYYRT